MQNNARGVVSAVALLVVGLCLVLVYQVRSLKLDIDAARGSLSDLKNEMSVMVETSAADIGVQPVITNVQWVVTNSVVTNAQVWVTNVIHEARTPVEQIGTNADEVAALVSAFQARSNEWVEVVNMAKFESEEARFALKTLSGRNAKIVKEKLALQKQIASLSASLNLLQAEKDRVAVEKDAAEVGESIDIAGVESVSLFNGQVADYNEALRMLILNLGTESGVKARMQFSVMNQGRWIARVRVVDPRRKLSGAEIVEILDGHTPKVGDRVIPYNSD